MTVQWQHCIQSCGVWLHMLVLFRPVRLTDTAVAVCEHHHSLMRLLLLYSTVLVLVPCVCVIMLSTLLLIYYAFMCKEIPGIICF